MCQVLQVLGRGTAADLERRLNVALLHKPLQNPNLIVQGLVLLGLSFVLLALLCPWHLLLAVRARQTRSGCVLVAAPRL